MSDSPAKGTSDPSRPLSGEQVYKRLVRSTVFIVTDQSIGSGVLVHGPRRLVLTNYHVIANQPNPIVFFPDFGSPQAMEPIPQPQHYLDRVQTLALPGTVVSESPQQDLALIELERLPAEIPPLPLSSTPAPIGSMLYSVGASGFDALEAGRFGGTLWRLSSGEARGRNRWSHRFPNQFVDAVFLENQKPINRGDSGGPTVNDRCQLVGLVSTMDLTRDAVRRDIDLSEVQRFLHDYARQRQWTWDGPRIVSPVSSTPKPNPLPSPTPPPPSVVLTPKPITPAVTKPRPVPEEPPGQIRELAARLRGTRWIWPDQNLRQNWFTLNADGSVTAGWHKQPGKWEATTGSTVRALITSSPRSPQTFDVDLKAGTLTNVQTHEVVRRSQTP